MTETLTHIGLIGDIHAEHERLERVLDTLEARGVERLLATGDVADGEGSVNRCCELLAARGVLAVRGNHDRWLLAGELRDLPAATSPQAVDEAARRWLETLPPTREFATAKGSLLLCHGLGANDMAKLNPDDEGYAVAFNDDLQMLLQSRTHRWVVNGHSHQHMVRHFPGVSIINAGTLKPGPAPGFFELDFEAGIIWRFELDGAGAVRSPPEPIPLFP